MNELQLLLDLHLHRERQGPGGEAETRRAIELARLDRSRPLNVADIGCGTGASSFVLASELDARITCVDFLPEFLDELTTRAETSGIADRLTTRCCSMDELPFDDGEFDVIWSEGAVYNMGFEAGVSAWKRFLRPGGALVVSEITWLTSARPPELESYWEAAYSEIDVASSKIAILERHGYCPVGYFVLPTHCWTNNYYEPLQNRFDEFLERHQHSEAATSVVAAEKEEIALYDQYNSYYGYGFYIAVTG